VIVMLAWRQYDDWFRHLFVGKPLQQMIDEVEARALPVQRVP
jgi:hypothetical protein